MHYYFAYGSNMSFRRLAQRVPSARRIATCRLPGHDLRFHKVGQDGSAKCDAYETGHAEDQVLGSLYLIDPAEKPLLDRLEGLGNGYEEKRVTVISMEQASYEALTYYATAIDVSLRPYSWYVRHVLVGADEAGLPLNYLDRIHAIAAEEDPDDERDGRERSVHP